MKYIISVAKSNGDMFFQAILDDPSKLREFCIKLCKDLEAYFSYRYQMSPNYYKPITLKSQQAFLEDIADASKNKIQCPYFYWITDDIFITVLDSETDNYAAWEKTINPNAPKPETFDFISTASREEVDDVDIGKVKIIKSSPKTVVKPIIKSNVTFEN